jgi:hypothetical protein
LIDVYFFLEILFIFTIWLFGFIPIFPIMKEMVDELFSSDFAAGVVAFCATLASLGHAFYLAFSLITLFICSITLLASLISGFSLMVLSKNLQDKQIPLHTLGYAFYYAFLYLTIHYTEHENIRQYARPNNSLQTC